MSDDKSSSSVGGRRVLRNIGVGLVVLAGLASLGTGVYFIFTDQPFDAQGYSEELDMTREEARAASPEMESWVRHVQNQVGSVSGGWGLFVILLALTGLRWGHEFARNVLWVGALPTLLYSSLHEFLEFGTIDTGTLLSMGAAVLFIIGMGLTYLAPGSHEEPTGSTLRGTRTRAG